MWGEPSVERDFELWIYIEVYWETLQTNVYMYVLMWPLHPMTILYQQQLLTQNIRSKCKLNPYSCIMFGPLKPCSERDLVILGRAGLREDWGNGGGSQGTTRLRSTNTWKREWIVWSGWRSNSIIPLKVKTGQVQVTTDLFCVKSDADWAYSPTSVRLKQKL